MIKYLTTLLLLLAFNLNAVNKNIIFSNDFYTIFDDYTYHCKLPRFAMPEELKQYKPFHLMNSDELGEYLDHHERLVEVYNDKARKCWKEAKQFFDLLDKPFHMPIHIRNNLHYSNLLKVSLRD
jgi:hypothetical protein